MIRTKAVYLLALLTACQSTVDPRFEAIDVRTEGSEFVLSPAEGQVAIPLSISNEGSSSVLLAGCDGHVLIAVDRRESGEWVPYTSSRCLTVVMMNPVELEARGILSAVTILRERGDFRLRLGVRTGTETEWALVSEPFVVR